jgi:hypothetical protein
MAVAIIFAAAISIIYNGGDYWCSTFIGRKI